MILELSNRCRSMGCKSNQDFCDQEQKPPSSNSFGRISCTTFNILAPIYKRLDAQNCESEFRELWLTRNEGILDRLLNSSSSIICLQEFWVHNEEFVRMYEKRLGDAGYVTYKLARTNNRGDGLLTALLCNHFHVVDYREFLFNDIGDRVAQLLHVELIVHSFLNPVTDIEKRVLIVYKILQYIDSYCHEHQLPPVPVILCGDWNGSKKGNVYKFLQSQGFVSSYDVAHPYSDDGEDLSKWISHHNHRGNVCGVDFIWLRNPSKHWKPLKESFMEALLGNIKNLAHKLSTEGISPLHFLENDGNHITYSQFSQAFYMLGLNVHSEDGVGTEDMKDLWEHMDGNGDGVIDQSEFDVWNPCSLDPPKVKEDSEETKELLNTHSTTATRIIFNVVRAMFLPSEVERGIWPENYSLSDHAQLNVEFSVVQLCCS